MEIEGLSSLAYDERAELGQYQVPAGSIFRISYYYSAPKQKINPKNLDEIDPELKKTFEKLGISLDEQKRLSGVAVDAVIDSVSIGTTFKSQLAELGIIFCSMSEAIQEASRSW